MDRGPLFLTLDQGGSASRALVFDARGHERASARIDVGDRRPRAGWVEQDPDEVVDSLRRAANEVVGRLGADDRAQVRSCSLSTQRSSLVAWDRESGAALSPVLSWQDTRAAAWLQAQALDVEAVRTRTGLYPNAHYGLSKIHWCLDHLEAVREAAADGRLLIGPLAAFLAFRLLEQRPVLVDPANASRTLLLDLARGDWDEATLARFGIERAWLPHVARSDADYGELVLDDGRRLPLRLLSGDQSTAAFAHGELRAEAACLNVGTGAFVFRASTQAPPARLLRSVVHWGDAPEYVVEGTINGAGAALEVAASRTQFGYETGEAGEVLYLNGIGGLGSPDWRPDFPSRFVGEGTPAQQLVAVAESIVFLIERNLVLLQALDPPCTFVLASGGLSQSDRFCQTLADLCGLPIRRPEQCEATARGAAFLLADRPADWPALPHKEFLPRANAGLHERHRRWQEAMATALASL